MKKILTMLCICTSLLAYAQTEYDLHEVVISGSRFPDTRKELAQKIDIIKPEQIRFSNSSSTADLLQKTGKVLVQKSQFGGGSPILRGFEASRVLLVVDGVRMNNAIYRAGHLQNVITMDQSMLDHIEIAYGPSSVAYGSDALGGVIHFHTLQPALKKDSSDMCTGAAFLRYGTAAEEIATHLHFNLGGKKWASLSSVSYSDFGDLHSGSIPLDGYSDFGFRPYYVESENGVDVLVQNPDKTDQIQSAYTQYDVLEKILFQPNANVSHVLNLQYSTTSDIPRYDRLTDPLNDDSLRYAQWYYGPQDRLLAAYDLHWHTPVVIYDDLHFVASFQAIEESRHQRRFGSSNLQHRTENVSVIGLNLDASKKIHTHTIRYGLESYLNTVHSAAEAENITSGEISALDTRYPDGGSSMNNFAAFIAHKWDMRSGKWILNDGLRYNFSMLHSVFNDQTFFPFPFNEVDQNNGALTGNLGVIFLPAKDTRIAVNFSTGFRTPNIDDLTKVFESGPGSIVVPNTDLQPEYSYNADLSLMHVFAEKLECEITGFYTRFTNYLVVQPGTFDGADSIVYDGEFSEVLTTENAGKAYVYGVQAGLDYALTAQWSLSSYITYTYGRILTDTVPYPLDHIPPVFGRTTVRYKTAKFQGECYVLYNGWKHIEDYNIVGGEDNEQYATEDGMPSWFTINLSLGYDLNDHFTLQAGCENILDRHYRVFASGISAPGRNLFATVRARF